MMNIVFRVDAAPHMGGGHLSRCLTLANGLKKKGFTSLFILRNHPNCPSHQVTHAGHSLVLLPFQNENTVDVNSYSSWVGASWDFDAEQTLKAMTEQFDHDVDWLIVDHYGLDACWEEYFLSKGIKVGVIDDLVNRTHSSLFLLDQTCGRVEEEYKGLVSPGTMLFVGESYCLLRDEFFQLRNSAISRRKQLKTVRKLLINFGSTDPTGHTLKALKGLKRYAVETDVEVLIVVGSACPFIDEIKEASESLAYKVKLYIDSTSMAELIKDSDLAIGAAGVSTWERCFLGLPTLLVKTAENQTDVVQRVIRSGAAIGYFEDLECENSLLLALKNIEKDYSNVSESALNMDIGGGLDKVITLITEDM
ncbi:UDP-2,4-diacetamido-2,4,6-trideoxy-beta-L-altropyranose hydrolase [Aliivibrio sp. 1S128]|uniref:UDP-2,4-diacetamido-2,4, 6-trideoxy-beta-L-altropyranose hydrolase n=1 Tax=Aliivibrio sp. 1S128 TaxID=1840085 RepID=UPI00080DD8C9|nr:UDP-2,4-diacetamido-2,4,6-trideoxy-beta-L-altropyranose hydrolase [Aliivibrio sp. 1S128]OCH25513.1 UDP-2,4-diacetamido-2,4,6-trideoxy-beta-L-altropyranose hydrolase [Aliivibrio sp. 1S128]